MGMFLAVGQGSDNPPRMIVMRSGGEGEKDALGRHLALVGKGVCFDSGGISIKPADRMEEMKMDKTGACTVIAAIATVARLAPGHAAPGRRARGREHARPACGPARRHRPGAQRQDGRHHQHGRRGPADPRRRDDLRGALGATHIVDVATLTGRRRPGDRPPGDGRVRHARRPGTTRSRPPPRRAGERYWQLPLVEDYCPEMESWYADMPEHRRRRGRRSMRSGLFLRQFATVPWAHLDIAGTGYFRKATPWAARGATGVTHATLVELALAGARA